MEQLARAERYLGKIRAIYAGTFSYSHDKMLYEDDLLSFFVHCYHVRDWIVRLNNVGVTARDVDAFISTKRCLQICADLCNGTKHCELNRSPRSGCQPHVSVKKYESSTWLTGSGGGEVICAKYTIFTSDGQIDALQLGEECMSCWQEYIAALKSRYR